MFTGIVERIGRVTSISHPSGPLCTLNVDAGPDFARQHGDSIAVNGVCLSDVSSANSPSLTFHVSPETVNKTALSSLHAGSIVNLERSIRANDRLGGHIVTGHIDACGKIIRITPEGGFHALEIEIPKNLSKYVVAKGSIAIDGISLTINSVSDEKDHCRLTFMIIPVTWQNTRLSDCQKNSLVNIETDIIAKHLERLASPWLRGDLRSIPQD